MKMTKMKVGLIAAAVMGAGFAFSPMAAASTLSTAEHAVIVAERPTGPRETKETREGKETRG